MKDIIWTLVIIWFIYRIVGIFKKSGQKKSFTGYQTTNHQQATPGSATKKDIKKAVEKHLNNEGEYVDFEEVK